MALSALQPIAIVTEPHRSDDVVNPPSRLRSERLLLRLPAIGDAQAVYERYAADPEVTRYLTWAPHESAETVAAFLEDLIGRIRAGEEMCWVIARPEDDRPLGMIGARVRAHKADIGYVLGRQWWGRGYMTEAVTAVTGWLLSEPAIVRVWAVCDTENTASARVLEKAGFEREGTLRRWMVLPNRSKKPRDCHVYGRVR